MNQFTCFSQHPARWVVHLSYRASVAGAVLWDFSPKFFPNFEDSPLILNEVQSLERGLYRQGLKPGLR